MNKKKSSKKSGPKKEAPPQINQESLDVYKQSFVEELTTNLRENNIQGKVDENFSSNLQDLYFKNSTFPKTNYLVALKDSKVRTSIYKLLFYRHIYVKVEPSIENMNQIWDQFLEVFDMILEGNQTLLKDLDLPNEWVWDIVDEFIYQFQTIENKKSSACLKGGDHLNEIKKLDPKKWNIITILQYLENFVQKSGITETLSRPYKDGESILNATGYKHLMQLFGYICLESLLRLNSLIGDYYFAVKIAEPIVNLGRLKNRTILSEITPICHIDTYYYLSFSQMMMRRYNESIISLQYILSYIEKNKQYIQSRSYQYQQLFKKTEQLYAILTIAISLCPQPIEYSLYSKVVEKNGDHIEQIRDGETAGFEQLFHISAPKFISPNPPNYDVKEDRNLSALSIQKELFLSDVNQQLSLPKISSYLKLYSSIEISKLAKFSNITNEELIKILLTTKHKTRKVINSIKMRGDSSGVNFFIIKDMIHVDTNKKYDGYKKIYVDEFIVQSGKLQRYRRNLMK